MYISHPHTRLAIKGPEARYYATSKTTFTIQSNIPFTNFTASSIYCTLSLSLGLNLHSYRLAISSTCLLQCVLLWRLYRSYMLSLTSQFSYTPLPLPSTPPHPYLTTSPNVTTLVVFPSKKLTQSFLHTYQTAGTSSKRRFCVATNSWRRWISPAMGTRVIKYPTRLLSARVGSQSIWTLPPKSSRSPTSDRSLQERRK